MTIRIWGAGTGAGTDGLASTAANWTGDVLPGVNDDIRFDGSVVLDCRWDVAWNIAVVDQQAAYTGKIDAGIDDLSHAISGNAVFAGNAFTAGNGTYTVGGNFDISGVTLFVVNSMALVMTGVSKTISTGGKSIKAVTIQAGADIALVGSWNCDALTIDGKFDDGGDSFNVNGSLLIANTPNLIISTGVWNVSASASLSNPHSTNRIGGLGIGGFLQTVTLTGNFYAGSVNLDGASVNFDLDSFTIFNGGTWINTSCNFDAQTGKVVHDGSSGVLTWQIRSGDIYNDVTINTVGATSFKLLDNVALNGNFLMSDGVMDVNDFDLDIEGGLTTIAGTLTGGTGTIFVSGSISFATSTFTAETSTLRHDGTSGTPTLTTNANTLNNLVINNAGVTSFSTVGVTTVADLTMTAGNLTLGSAFTMNGTFNGNGGTFDFNGSQVNIAESWINTGSTITMVAADILNFNGTSGTHTFNPKSDQTYGRVWVDTVGMTNFSLVGTNLTCDQLEVFSVGTIFNHTATEIFITNQVFLEETSPGILITAPITFKGTATMNFDPNDNTVGNIIVTNEANTFNMNNNFNVVDFTIGNLSTVGTFGGTTEMICRGSWFDTGATWTPAIIPLSFKASSGTQTFTSGGNAYGDITVDNSGVTSFILQDTLDINGDVTLTAGAIDFGANAVNFEGNWTEAGGFAFTEGTSDVTIDGAGATIFSGSTTFYDLSCSTAEKSITFDNAGDVAVTNNFVLQGASGNLIILVSDLPGTRWGLNVSGSHNVTFVNVTDSDASAGNTISAFNSVGEAQNNVNWSFPGDPVGNDPQMFKGIGPLPGWFSHRRGGR